MDIDINFLEYFPDKIILEDAGLERGTRLFKVKSKFRFYSSKGLIIVNENEITDGASIPKIFHSIIGPFGLYFHSALIHDSLYKKSNKYNFTRKECDDLFDEGMKVSGVPFITRKIIYSAVRSFGWLPYKKE